MLISNKVDVETIVNMHLEYDDDTLNKDITLKKGDLVTVEYSDIKNRVNNKVSGKIIDIRVNDISHPSYSRITDPIKYVNDIIITIDSSTEYNASVYKVNSNTIIEITKEEETNTDVDDNTDTTTDPEVTPDTSDNEDSTI